MIGIVLAAAAVGAVAGQVSPNAVAGELEVIPAAIVEAQAGEAPLVYGKAPTLMVTEVITPGLGLRYHGRRLELLAGYQLRMFWRQGEQVDARATPLLLNTLNLSLTGRPTRRLELKVTGTAYEGQTDYTYFSSSIYQNQQPAVTVPPTILSANVTGEANLHVTPLATAGIALQAVHSQPIGQTTTGRDTTLTTPTTAPLPTTPPLHLPALTLPNFTSFAATPGAAVRVSRTDDLSSALALQYQDVSNMTLLDSKGAFHPGSAVSAFIVSPTFGFHRVVSPHSEFTLKAGLAVAHLDSDVTGVSDSFAPIGSAALDVRLMNLRRAILQLKLLESLDYYLDPVLAIAADRANTTVTLALGLPKNWTIAFEGSFVTPLAAHPQPQPPPTAPIYFDEVAAAAQLAARHLLTDELLLEFGGRWADRSPFFTAPNYGFHQRQLFLYVTLAGTTHPSWAPQREVAALQ